MSTVKLTTFAAYKLKGPRGAVASTIETVFGATAARFGADGKVELLADSVPFHADSFKSRAPKQGAGLLMLYGNRDALEESFYWRTKARELGAEFASAEFEIDVGDLEMGLTDRQMLIDTEGKNRFLNLRRMKKDLQLDVLAKFAEYIAAEGGDVEKRMSIVAHIATRPDIFDLLLQEDIELSRLDVLVIPVADDPANPAKIRQVAYVKSGAKVVSVSQSGTGATILLPSWMTDQSAAAKRQTYETRGSMKKVIERETTAVKPESESPKPPSRHRPVRV